MELTSQELLECFRRATTDLNLCPNRVWTVAGDKLPILLPNITPTPDGVSNVLETEEKDSNSHELCTFDFCEYSQRDFTAVQQRHECKETDCTLLRALFPRPLLDRAAYNNEPTVWNLAGDALLESPRPYLAISHVWSDGTGAGAWSEAQVNECLYSYFRDIATQFHCDGIWWDTICIPKEKAARNKAIRKIQENYRNARVTLVHDCFLRNWEWDPQTACFGIIMSPWFSRGWTSLELANSRKVKVIFKGKFGPVIKDLDEEILAMEGEPDGPRREASQIIRHLREDVKTLNGVLNILKPRYTSWPKDISIISALLVGIKARELQQDTYRDILKKLGKLHHEHMFHNAATMSKAFCWCPTNLHSMPAISTKPLGSVEPLLTITGRGDIKGIWRVSRIDLAMKGNLVWNGLHPLIRRQLEEALKDTENCRLLGEPGEELIIRGLLVKATQANKLQGIYCYQYVGALYFRSEVSTNNWNEGEAIILGQPDGKQGTSNVSTAYEELHNDVPDSLHYAAWAGNHSHLLQLIEKTDASVPDQLGQLPLHLAAERGDLQAVQILLGKSNLESQCALGQTALHRAAWGGSTAVVKLLLEMGSDRSARDKSGNLPLHMAAKMGFEAVVVLLLESDSDSINAKDDIHLTPLHHAALGGHEEVVQALLERGADAKATDQVGWTPLHCAAESGNEEAARLLVKYDADIDIKDSLVGWTPLHFAAIRGLVGTVKMLLEMGATDVADAHGWTPYHFAKVNEHHQAAALLSGNDAMAILADGSQWTLLHCTAADSQQGLIKSLSMQMKRSLVEGIHPVSAPLPLAAELGLKTALQKLLKMNADTEESDENDRTALSHAAEKGHTAIVHILLKNDADFNTVDKAHNRTPLLWATGKGQMDVIQLLLDKGASVNSVDTNGRTPLFYAIFIKRIDVVQLLLDNRASLNVYDHEGQTPLLCAAREGSREVIKLLLDKGDDVNAMDMVYGRTPIWRAIINGHEAVAQLLVGNGANLYHTDYDGQTLLSWAAENGNTAVVQSLVNLEPDPNRKDNYGRTPMSWAAERGHAATIQLLLDNGADVNAAESGSGWTPLFWAALNGHTDVSRLLLENGSIFNGKDAAHGRMPFSYAAENGHWSVMQLLLSAGVDFKAHDFTGKTALKYAISGGHNNIVQDLIHCGADENPNDSLLSAALEGHIDIIQSLLVNGSNVNYQSRYGTTPLTRAVSQQCDDSIVSLMLASGANPDLKGERDETPLSLAAHTGHIATTQLLLSHGANIITKNKNGESPLHHAAKHGHETIVQLLLEHGADPDCQDNKHQTPLHNAVTEGHASIVKTLIDKGANITMRNHNIETPLSCALGRGQRAIIQLLLDEGADISPTDQYKGNLVLLWAAKLGDLTVSKLLLDKGADPNCRGPNTGRAAISYASESGNIDLVQLLLKLGATVDCQENDGGTPLWWAASNGHVAILQALLDRGASVNVTERGHYSTALSMAAQNGHETVVQLLLQNGADPARAPMNEDHSPLCRAAQGGHESITHLFLKGNDLTRINELGGKAALSVAAGNGHEAIVRTLVDLGVVSQSNDRDDNDRIPLPRAAMNGHKSITQFLYEKGVDIDVYHLFCGGTLLWWAAVHGDVSFLQVLIDKGADLESQCSSSSMRNEGKTPLSGAAGSGHKAAVQFLIYQGAKVDSTDRFGRTPLYYAAANGHDGVVKLLLNHNANPNLRDSRGETALSIAAYEGNEAVVSALLDKAVNLESRDLFCGQTALWCAAIRGYENIVRLLIKRGANTTLTNRMNGGRPLTELFWKRHRAAVCLLHRVTDELLATKSYFNEATGLN